MESTASGFTEQALFVAFALFNLLAHTGNLTRGVQGTWWGRSSEEGGVCRGCQPGSLEALALDLCGRTSGGWREDGQHHQRGCKTAQGCSSQMLL